MASRVAYMRSRTVTTVIFPAMPWARLAEIFWDVWTQRTVVRASSKTVAIIAVV